MTYNEIKVKEQEIEYWKSEANMWEDFYNLEKKRKAKLIKFLIDSGTEYAYIINNILEEKI